MRNSDFELNSFSLSPSVEICSIKLSVEVQYLNLQTSLKFDCCNPFNDTITDITFVPKELDPVVACVGTIVVVGVYETFVAPRLVFNAIDIDAL